MVSFDAIVFDMDGVLFDTESVSKRGWFKVAQEMNIPDIAETLKNCTGVTQPTMRAYFQTRYGADFPYDDFHTRTSTLFYETLEREGVQLMPGVKELLAWLRAQGKAIGIASSSRMEVILHHLDQHDLRPYFDAILSGDRVQNGKPDPEIYLKACAMLGKEPARCIGIEDSLNGVRAVHAAGMKAVMVPDQIEPTDEIRALTFAIRDSLHEVKDWLSQEETPETWDLYTPDAMRSGKTILRGEEIPEGYFHMVAEVFVRHADGDYLFMQRDAKKIGCPGLWECGAGGALRRGEDAETAAWRELQEETGLTRGVLRQLGWQQDGHMIITHYLLQTDEKKDSVTLQNGETMAYRWMGAEKAFEFVQTPACVPFLKARFAQYREALLG